MQEMQWEVRFPGRAATDPRITVTLIESGTPWPIRFYFLRLDDVGTGVREIINTGFDIGQIFEIEREQTVLEVDDDQVIPIDAAVLQRIAENYGTYLEAARHMVLLKRAPGAAEAFDRLRGPLRPGRLTNDFYRRVAADFQAHQQSGGTQKTFAMKNNTHPANVSKWLAESRRRGYLPEKGES